MFGDQFDNFDQFNAPPVNLNYKPRNTITSKSYQKSYRDKKKKDKEYDFQSHML